MTHTITSQDGLTAIETREGRELIAYRDTRGILTIGVGHTGRMSKPPVTPGMRITQAQCDAMLATDLAPVEDVINSAVKVPISQNEFDALASLGFNIGTGGLKGSTVIRRLNVGDIKGAAEAFMQWSKPAALIERRKKEAAQFLKPDPTVTADRAKALSTNAKATRAKATNTNAGASAIAVAGIATMPVAASHSHHWLLIVVAGVALIVTAIVAALLAEAAHAAADEMEKNALDHAAAAAVTPAPVSAPLALVK